MRGVEITQTKYHVKRVKRNGFVFAECHNTIIIILWNNRQYRALLNLTKFHGGSWASTLDNDFTLSPEIQLHLGYFYFV